MGGLQRIIDAIETHDIESIRSCFSEGIDPNEYYNGVPLIYELTSEYARGPKFKECVKAFVDFGLRFEFPELLAVLLNDAQQLGKLLSGNPESIHKTYSLRCAYTPIHEATLLHICAEFNQVECAKVLVQYGIDLNAPAGIDENGFGGQTAIYHTVNQNGNHSKEMLHYLLSFSPDLKTTIKGLIWGKGYPWETFIPSVNPVSYAMMGLLPQMHRSEKTIAETVSLLMKHAYGIEYTSRNVPNSYLH
jgi:hypothetical protein